MTFPVGVVPDLLDDPGAAARPAQVKGAHHVPALILDQVHRVAAGRGEGYREQTVRFTIEPVSVKELGAFLGAWRSGQPGWTVRQAELSHTGKDDEQSFRAVLQVSALYVSDRAADPQDDLDKENH